MKKINTKNILTKIFNKQSKKKAKQKVFPKVVKKRKTKIIKKKPLKVKPKIVKTSLTKVKKNLKSTKKTSVPGKLESKNNNLRISKSNEVKPEIIKVKRELTK